MTSRSVTCWLSVSIVSPITSTGARRNSRLVHGHLIFGFATLVVFRTDGWDEIQEERKDEERIHERDDPFQNSRGIVPFALVFDAKSCKL